MYVTAHILSLIQAISVKENIRACDTNQSVLLGDETERVTFILHDGIITLHSGMFMSAKTVLHAPVILGLNAEDPRNIHGMVVANTPVLWERVRLEDACTLINHADLWKDCALAMMYFHSQLVAMNGDHGLL